jgi:hypothetical protein
MKTSRTNFCYANPALLTIGLVLCAIVCCSGQDYWNKIKRSSFGISVGHYDIDPGIAGQFTSPLFWNERLSLRLSGALQWMETYTSNGTDFVPYNTFRTGLVYNFPMIDKARVYLEGGYFMVIPNKSISEKSVINGGYGVTGLELFFYQKPKLVALYFFELGFIALKDNEKRSNDGHPYSEGMMFTTGFRFHPFGTVE